MLIFKQQLQASNTVSIACVCTIGNAGEYNSKQYNTYVCTSMTYSLLHLIIS